MVNTREIAAEYRLGHWAEVMQERSVSGMSIKAYCKSIGLHENVYYYWQRKLREAAFTAAAQNGADGVLTTVRPNGRAAIPEGWALCEAGRCEPEQSTVQIEIGKSRVTVHAGTDNEILTRVCRVLVSLC